MPRSRVFVVKRGELESVGVGGVFTIIGAALPGGGVWGAAFVSIGWGLAVLGRSGDDVSDPVCDVCLSNILETTLPRLPFPVVSFSFGAVPALFSFFRSGLPLGLVPRRGLKASFNLPTGDGDRL